MQVRIYSTSGRDTFSPLLVIPDQPGTILPWHPFDLGWTYLATTTTQDALVAGSRRQIAAEIYATGYAIIDVERQPVGWR